MKLRIFLKLLFKVKDVYFGWVGVGAHFSGVSGGRWVGVGGHFLWVGGSIFEVGRCGWTLFMGGWGYLLGENRGGHSL